MATFINDVNGEVDLASLRGRYAHRILDEALRTAYVTSMFPSDDPEHKLPDLPEVPELSDDYEQAEGLETGHGDGRFTISNDKTASSEQERLDCTWL